MTEPQPTNQPSKADILSQAAKIIRAHAKPENMRRKVTKKHMLAMSKARWAKAKEGKE